MQMGILGIVGIIFLVLKLTGVGMVATWSWWWVLSPFFAWMVVVIVWGMVMGAIDWQEKRINDHIKNLEKDRP